VHADRRPSIGGGQHGAQQADGPPTGHPRKYTSNGTTQASQADRIAQNVALIAAGQRKAERRPRRAWPRLKLRLRKRALTLTPRALRLTPRAPTLTPRVRAQR
jgi:hypothetical protein